MNSIPPGVWNAIDYERLAVQSMDAGRYAYVAGGCGWDRAVAANRALLDQLPRPLAASGATAARFLPGEEDETCWACGVWIEGEPERAHVVAHSHGGPNTPDNFFLLCSRCHNEQPDEAPRAVQEAWLATREHYTVRQLREATTMKNALLWMMKREGIEEADVDFDDDEALAALDKMRRQEEPSAAGWVNDLHNRLWHKVTTMAAWMRERKKLP